MDVSLVLGVHTWIACRHQAPAPAPASQREACRSQPDQHNASRLWNTGSGDAEEIRIDGETYRRAARVEELKGKGARRAGEIAQKCYALGKYAALAVVRIRRREG